MNKVVVSVIGLDCPGVVYTVADTLSSLEGVIEEVSQTILKNQFAAIFIAAMPASVSLAALEERLKERIAEKKMHLTVAIRPFETGVFGQEPCEPFVVTVDGEDQGDILSCMTRLFVSQRVNITNLKAIRPEDAPQQCLLMFEIALPTRLDRSAFARTLTDKGAEKGLHVSMQHRDIFEALHRVSPL